MPSADRGASRGSARRRRATISCTRKPSGSGAPARRGLEHRAHRRAGERRPSRRRPTATPPTSLLCVISARQDLQHHRPPSAAAAACGLGRRPRTTHSRVARHAEAGEQRLGLGLVERARRAGRQRRPAARPLARRRRPAPADAAARRAPRCSSPARRTPARRAASAGADLRRMRAHVGDHAACRCGAGTRDGIGHQLRLASAEEPTMIASAS